MSVMTAAEILAGHKTKEQVRDAIDEAITEAVEAETVGKLALDSGACLAARSMYDEAEHSMNHADQLDAQAAQRWGKGWDRGL